MRNIKSLQYIFALFALILGFGLTSKTFAAATIVIANNDPAGVGFNDTTVVLPVGGNTGTTLGQQRLNAFNEAARIWGSTLDSNVTITVRAQWTALTCTATSAVLGSAGATTVHANFANAPFQNSWYGGALANKINGADLNTTTPEINTNFNVNLGQPNCLNGSPFYLGFDENEGTGVDLVAVLLHEFGHGLGFQTFTNGSTGARLGTAPNALPSIWDRFLFDNTTGKSWFNMTNAERVASALNSRKLAWNGSQVQTDAPTVLTLGTPLLKISSPAAIAGNYEVGTASFGPTLTASGITGNIVQAVDPNDAAGTSTTDGCSVLTNAPAIAGNVALIDRGTCGFTVKVKNAQNAGATAVIIADNAAGSPPAGLGGADATVTIPAVRISLPDANAIKAQLANNVSAILQLDNTVRAGADAFGRTLLFTPNPFQSGSSVSHFDTGASPNLLMEPSINTNLTHNVTTPSDLTFSLFRDIGWAAATTPAPTSITPVGNNAITIGVNGQSSTPLQIAVTNPVVSGVTITFTATTSPEGATGTFANSGSTLKSDGENSVSATNTRTATAVTDANGIATAPAFTANGKRGTYDINATVPGAGTTAFQATNSVTTAASATIGGRVFTPGGRGLRNARVTMTLQNGTTRTATTTNFGYYHFDNVAAGETVVLDVSSKRYGFASQILNVTGETNDFNFFAVR